MRVLRAARSFIRRCNKLRLTVLYCVQRRVDLRQLALRSVLMIQSRRERTSLPSSFKVGESRRFPARRVWPTLSA
jgi:hypothetical protein